jgi:hypothetical protein
MYVPSESRPVTQRDTKGEVPGSLAPNIYGWGC